MVGSSCFTLHRDRFIRVDVCLYPNDTELKAYLGQLARSVDYRERHDRYHFGYGDGVYRFLLTPRWLILHVVTVIILVACVLLGWWQLGVYHDNSDRHHIRTLDRVSVTTVARPGIPLGDAHDRLVIATGRYLGDQQLLVPGRVHDNVLGSYVVTPLQTLDGLIVPVLRGWVDESNDPAVAVPAGRVSVTGFVLPPETAKPVGRGHRPMSSDGGLSAITPRALAKQTSLPVEAMLQGYVLLKDQAPAPAVAPVVLDVDLVAPIGAVSPWQNLSYWAQWWVFAAAGGVFWVSAVRSAVRSRRDGVSESAQSAGFPDHEALSSKRGKWDGAG